MSLRFHGRLIYDSCECVLWRATSEDVLGNVMACGSIELYGSDDGLERVALTSSVHISDCGRFYACESERGNGVELHDIVSDKVLKSICVEDTPDIRQFAARVIDGQPYAILELYRDPFYKLFPSIPGRNIDYATFREWWDESVCGESMSSASDSNL